MKTPNNVLDTTAIQTLVSFPFWLHKAPTKLPESPVAACSPGIAAWLPSPGFPPTFVEFPSFFPTFLLSLLDLVAISTLQRLHLVIDNLKVCNPSPRTSTHHHKIHLLRLGLRKKPLKRTLRGPLFYAYGGGGVFEVREEVRVLYSLLFKRISSS